MARPSKKTKSLVDKICLLLAEGNSLRTICKMKGMPCQATVFNWIKADEELLKQYACAREFQAEKMANEILAIADEEVGSPLIVDGVPMMADGKPVMIVSSEAVAHARLRIDSRKWLASKMYPKKYGDKLALAGDDENPLRVVTIQGDDAKL